MNNSRKQIKAQIEMMDGILQAQKTRLEEHQEYFSQSKLKRYHLTTLAFLAAGFYVGWNIERKKLSKKIMSPIAEIGTLMVINSLKKALFTFLKQH